MKVGLWEGGSDGDGYGGGVLVLFPDYFFFLCFACSFFTDWVSFEKSTEGAYWDGWMGWG